MNRLVLAAAILIGSAGVDLTTLAAGQAAPRSVKDGVYTTAQADRGKALYDDACAVCHGSMASTTPSMAPLLNDFVFQDTWKTRSVGDLFDRIRNTMPQDAPGTLSPPRTAEIIAYILSANQFPAGSVALAEDVEKLKQIRLDAPQP